MYSNRAALRSRGRAGELAANASDSWASPFLQPVSDAPRAATVAAWAPVLSGQPVPMIGEEVPDGESRYRR